MRMTSTALNSEQLMIFDMTNSRVGRQIIPDKYRAFWKRQLYASAYGGYRGKIVIASNFTIPDKLIQTLLQNGVPTYKGPVV